MNTFPQIVSEHQVVLNRLETQYEAIQTAGALILDTLRAGGKLMLCGNGGSAADSQHIATEFVVRYHKNRRALPALALTTDTSILTAHPNDFEFETVFSRQIEALGNQGDCLIAISTSGNSGNILSAVSAAQQKKMKVIGLTGGSGGKLAAVSDCSVIVPSNVTARIQEMHILIAHWWCEQADGLES